eukprot:362245-Chlamydomonas_euryale.AAC.4
MRRCCRRRRTRYCHARGHCARLGAPQHIAPPGMKCLASHTAAHVSPSYTDQLHSAPSGGAVAAIGSMNSASPGARQSMKAASSASAAARRSGGTPGWSRRARRICTKARDKGWFCGSPERDMGREKGGFVGTPGTATRLTDDCVHGTEQKAEVDRSRIVMMRSLQPAI